MIGRTRWCLTLTALLLAVPSGAAPVPRIERDRIVARAVTPGGQVVLVGLGKGRANGLGALMTCIRSQSDSDWDGTIDFEPCSHAGAPKLRIPRYSAWLVVDVATAALGGCSPVGSLPIDAQSPLAAGSNVLSGGGVLSLAGGEVEVILIRRGVGVWNAPAGDGAQNDLDQGHNGVIRLPAAALAPVSPSFGAPGDLSPGDVIVTVDRMTLATRVTTVSGL